MNVMNIRILRCHQCRSLLLVNIKESDATSPLCNRCIRADRVHLFNRIISEAERNMTPDTAKRFLRALAKEYKTLKG